MFKNSRGILTGWTLQPLDAQRIRGEEAAEMVLSERPLFLFVRIPGVRWTMSETLGENIYPVKPVWKTWARDRAQQAKVRRCGFPIVPDFSGTAHSYTGATLPAAIADCLDWKRKPRREDMLKAYNCVSRVRAADDLLLVQPYNPWLFKQGQLAGPSPDGALARQCSGGGPAEGVGQIQWDQADVEVRGGDASALLVLLCTRGQGGDAAAQGLRQREQVEQDGGPRRRRHLRRVRQAACFRAQGQ